MVRIVETKNVGHIELKQTQGTNKLGLKKNSNWYTDPSRLMYALSHCRLISKVLQIDYQSMAQYLFVLSNVKLSAS